MSNIKDNKQFNIDADRVADLLLVRRFDEAQELLEYYGEARCLVFWEYLALKDVAHSKLRQKRAARILELNPGWSYESASSIAAGEWGPVPPARYIGSRTGRFS